MKKQEMLKENFMNMKTEYQISHHKICRKIDAIFAGEAKHFKNLLISFNNDYKCIDTSEINLISEKIQEIFNTCKVMLVEDYISRFDKNVDLLTYTMYDFFIKKLSNAHLKAPVKELNKYLNEICRFDSFLFEDKLENSLIDFSDNFIYMYVNCDEAKKDFVHLMKNINYSLVCDLKKEIANSVQDKQDIAARYNTLNKEIISKNSPVR